MRLTIPGLAACFALLLGAPAAQPHPGGTDANGCHYDRSKVKWQDTYHCPDTRKPPNPDVNAPVKKSRENICHDAGSPSYSQLKYFVAYQTMQQCTASGGHKYKS
jgi:hypothetical protein